MAREQAGDDDSEENRDIFSHEMPSKTLLENQPRSRWPCLLGSQSLESFLDLPGARNLMRRCFRNNFVDFRSTNSQTQPKPDRPTVRRSGSGWREKGIQMKLLLMCLATILASCFVFLTSATRGAETGAQTLNSMEGTSKEVLAQSGVLRIEEDDSVRFEGSLLPGEAKRPAVWFDSRVIAADEMDGKADGESKVVVTSVQTDDLSVDAKRDLKAQTLTVGADGEKMNTRQKRALTTLCRKLELYLGALGTELPQEEDLLLRTTCYFAEAPVGYELKNKTLRGPSTVYVQEAPPAGDGAARNPGLDQSATTEDRFLGLTQKECEQAEASGSMMVAAACQQNGQSGVVEIKKCYPYRLTVFWDSKNPSLCYGSRGNDRAGPCTSRCKGRCGAECGNSKNGFYTRDCAEHDDCSYTTDASGGRFDNNCGDEWQEAVDDFFQRYKRTCSNCLG